MVAQQLLELLVKVRALARQPIIIREKFARKLKETER